MRTVGKAINLAHASPRGGLYVYGDVYFEEATIRCACGHEDEVTTEAPWFWKCDNCGRAFAVAKNVRLIEYDSASEAEYESAGPAGEATSDDDDRYRRMRDGFACMQRVFTAAAEALLREADACGARGWLYEQKSMAGFAGILSGLAKQYGHVA